MPPHVQVTHWESADSQKGQNLTYQQETIVWHLPVPKEFKSQIIDVLNQFQTDFGCKLTLRGRKEMEQKRAKMAEDSGADVPKLHQIILHLLENRQQSQGDRLEALRRAEAFVDAFLKNMVKSPKDLVYMFPADSESKRSEETAVAQQRPTEFLG